MAHKWLLKENSLDIQALTPKLKRFRSFSGMISGGYPPGGFVINENKHSVDILCIETIIKDQFCTLTIISMHNSLNDCFFSFISTVVILRNDSGIIPEFRRKSFRKKTGIF